MSNDRYVRLFEQETTLIRSVEHLVRVCCNTRCFRAVNVTCLKSRVGLRQTAHYWANAGVLLGARVRRRVAFETIKLIDAKVLRTIII